MPNAITPGDPYPLGASWDGSGTNFAVFSQSAESVDLCLFDEAGNETVYELPEVDAYVWHGYLEEAEPGQLYGYRVRGTYDPGRGLAGQPCQAPARPLRQGRFGRGRLGPGRLQLQVPQRRRRDRWTRPIRRLLCRSRWSSTRPSTGPTTTGPARLGTTPIIYETHVRGLTCAIPRSRRHIGALTPGWRTRRSSSISSASASLPSS